MDWLQASERRRALPPEEAARIRLAGLSRKAARSLAFEGEPVELVKRQAELARPETRPARSRLTSGS